MSSFFHAEVRTDVAPFAVRFLQDLYTRMDAGFTKYDESIESCCALIQTEVPLDRLLLLQSDMAYFIRGQQFLGNVSSTECPKVEEKKTTSSFVHASNVVLIFTIPSPFSLKLRFPHPPSLKLWCPYPPPQVAVSSPPFPQVMISLPLSLQLSSPYAPPLKL